MNFIVKKRIKFSLAILLIYILIFILLLPIADGWIAGIYLFLTTLPIALIKIYLVDPLSIHYEILNYQLSSYLVKEIIYYFLSIIYIFYIGYLISIFFCRKD
ncbi:hypothetical protein [Neisseria zalophi]|uniref:Uncharacterized protein n=1 Tax=Neisseria zalophi TaxID=640030 RepID=A0A5J6PRK9_9NEIS|nr:hypothetical protein [Neisseria zalophi]QEY25331.1 hypothetical protein D0T92_01440 [Neisseria zalophi]